MKRRGWKRAGSTFRLMEMVVGVRALCLGVRALRLGVRVRALCLGSKFRPYV